MSTLAASDPIADKILDLIAEHESAGNYNAVIGNARATADLSAYDLPGIYALMDRLIQKGNPSTAVGRYQFIRATLKATVKLLGLPDTTRFTPEIQDKLCLALLGSACSFTSWRAGVTSHAWFAHLLSTQWASLPDPDNGGRSHYDGVGPNHAGTTLDHVYEVLSRALAATGATPAQGPVREAVKALQSALHVSVDGLMDKDGATLTAYFAYRAQA